MSRSSEVTVMDTFAVMLLRLEELPNWMLLALVVSALGPKATLFGAKTLLCAPIAITLSIAWAGQRGEYRRRRGQYESW